MTSQGKTLDSVSHDLRRLPPRREPTLGPGTPAILGQLLRRMYGDLCKMPVPDRLLAIVDRIEDPVRTAAEEKQ
jgi:hypothetical protein